MGQKTHPYGFRLGITKPWRSRWFAKRDYSRLLHEDLKLKRDLKKQLAHQVKSVRAARVSRGSSKPGELPFTGFPAWAVALIGSVLLTAGLGLRKLAS